MRRGLAGALAGVLAAGTATPSARALEWPGQADQMRERMRSDESEARVEAIRALSGSDPAVALELLTLAASDPSVDVRQAAAEWIGEARAWEAESVAVSLLSDRRAPVRVAAATALGSLRTVGALDPLARALADTDADVRLAAIAALAALGRPESVPALLAVTQDPSREVVVSAVEALGELGDPGAVFALLEKLHDPVASVAVAAAGALGQLRAQEAVPGLIELAQTGRVDEVVAAIDALGRIGSRDAVPVLLSEVLNPRFNEGQTAAASVLRQLPDPRVTTALLPQLSTHAAARDLLAATGPDEWALLHAAWQAGAHGAREELLDAWLRTGDPSAVEAAQRWLLAEGATPLEQAAALALSPTEEAFCARVDLTPPDSLEAWESVLAHAAEAGAGRCFVDVVDQTEVAARPPLDVLAETMRHLRGVDVVEALDRWIDVDRVDSDAAAVVCDVALEQREAAAPLLLRLLASRSREVRREAGWALADLRGELLGADDVAALIERAETDPTIAAALIGMLQGPHAPAVRTAATTWLGAGHPGLRAEGWAAAAEACSLIGNRAGEVSDERDLWARSAAARALLACGRLEELAALDGLPGVGAMVARGVRVADADDSEAAQDREDDELVAWIARELEAQGGDALPLEALVGDRSAAVRSAARLAQSRLGTGAAPGGLALLAAATESPLERQVIAAIVRAAGDQEALDRVVRVSDELQTARVARGVSPAFGSPLQVVLVDEPTNTPLAWHPVFLVWDDLSFSLERTDASGRLRVGRSGVIIAWPLGLEP